MIIEHIALWTNNLEQSKDFYCHFFGGTANQKYTNPTKKFESYFITFDSGCRLEIMTIINLQEAHPNKSIGLAHFTLKVENKQKVDELTEYLRTCGVVVFGEPRITGDGYYESVVLDPDGNQIEITA
ncbi:MAG: VOC family protein [Brevinema sp.]